MTGSSEHGHRGESLRHIGRYQLEAVIGAGAFATVYRAFDERLEDTVAVKVLAENHSLDAELRERFLTEGRVLRRITSPHVITVHDLGETGDRQPYLVLEHADRGTLTQRVTELRACGWRPTPADLLAVAEPIAAALEAIHRVSVIHRDVNPGNVLVTSRGTTASGGAVSLVRHDEELLLADLGLCKDLARSSGHTSAGGTEGFRPPELSHGPALIDQRADLWSLSALMVWVVTGAPPRGPGSVEPAITWAGLPRQLARALDRALATRPDARHPDATTWLADVRRALTQPPPPLPLPPAVPSPTLAPPTTTPSPLPAAPAPPHVTASPPPLPPQAWWPASPQLPGPLWRLRHSAWLLATLGFGLTTWVGFLYLAVRTKRRAWRWAASLYGLAAAALITLVAMAPTDAAGDVQSDAWQNEAGVYLMMVTFFFGIGHGLVANRTWLEWRAASERQRGSAAGWPPSPPPTG